MTIRIDESINLLEWNCLIDNMEVETLLERRDLFWITFCQAVNNIENERVTISSESAYLNVSIEKDLSFNLRNSVEKIRLIFLSCFTSFEPATINIMEDDLQTTLNIPFKGEFQINTADYRCFFNSSWSKLAKFLNANLSFNILQNTADNPFSTIYHLFITWDFDVLYNPIIHSTLNPNLTLKGVYNDLCHLMGGVLGLYSKQAFYNFFVTKEPLMSETCLSLIISIRGKSSTFYVPLADLSSRFATPANEINDFVELIQSHKNKTDINQITHETLLKFHPPTRHFDLSFNYFCRFILHCIPNDTLDTEKKVLSHSISALVYGHEYRGGDPYVTQAIALRKKMAQSVLDCREKLKRKFIEKMPTLSEADFDLYEEYISPTLNIVTLILSIKINIDNHSSELLQPFNGCLKGMEGMFLDVIEWNIADPIL